MIVPVLIRARIPVLIALLPQQITAARHGRTLSQPERTRSPTPGEVCVSLRIILKPFRVEPTLRALSPFRIFALTVTQVRGYGRQKSHLELYKGSEYAISFIPKASMHLVVARSELDDLVRAVENPARTGRIGDGKIFTQETDFVEF